MGGGRTERACEKRREEARKERDEAAGLVSFAGTKGQRRRMETDGSRNGRSFSCAREAASATQVLRGIHEAPASDDPRTGEELRSDAGSVGKERRGMMQRSVQVALLDEVGRGGRGRGAANKHRGNGDGLGELSNV